MAKFFHFNQNNSGGSFHFMESEGITHHVVIEARDSEDANVIAIMKGLYFEGCNSGKDCSCCGDRWYRVGEWSKDCGDDVPSVYGEPLGVKSSQSHGWMNPGRETAVHYLDGRIEWFDRDNTKALA
jgi:hypothetical protein